MAIQKNKEGNTENSLSQNKWQHIALSYNAISDSSNVKLYIDGLKQPLKRRFSDIQNNLKDNATKDLYIANDSTKSKTFQGSIDDVRLWQVERTTEQIHALMNTELKGDENGLLGYWKMDEGIGTLIYDQSVNNNNGTASCSWIEGKYLETDSTSNIAHNNIINNPESFTLFQNYPNPFNPVTVINYQLPQRANVSLKIYNTLGQLVQTLVNDIQVAGEYKITWDGKNFGGESVSSGIYLYILEAGEVRASNKMLLIR